MNLHPYRCETCDYFIGKMTNYFGADQPFCKHPKMIEYYKGLPKDPGRSEDGQCCWLPAHVVREGDMNFRPMSEYAVAAYRVLGCASHSANPHNVDVDAVRVEEREKLYNWIKTTFWIHDDPEYTHEEWIKTILDHIHSLNEGLKNDRS